MGPLAAIPIIGGAFSALGSLNQADQNSAMLNDEANIQEQNAVLARKTAKFNEMRQQTQAQKAFGSISANVGASGITADSGNVLDLLRQSHVNAELDRQNIVFGGEIRAFNALNSANSARLQARDIQKNKWFNAAGALFGAAAPYANFGGSKAKLDDGLGSTSSGSGYGSAGESYNGDAYA